MHHFNFQGVMVKMTSSSSSASKWFDPHFSKTLLSKLTNKLLKKKILKSKITSQEKICLPSCFQTGIWPGQRGADTSSEGEKRPG